MSALFESIYNLVIEIMQYFGPFGLFIGMIIQAILAPIPSELVLTAAGASFPLFTAILFGGLGEIAGAIVAFYISKKFGRAVVIRLVGKEHLEFSDKWFDKYGTMAVLIGRLLPFVPFDAVSYGAGLTTMDKKKFIAATSVGAFPRAAFYVFLGWAVNQRIETVGFENMFILLSIIASIFIVFLYFFPKWISKRL